MDAAALSLKIDSSSVVSAANDLDRFSAAADRAGKSAGNQSGSIAKLAASAQSMDAKLSTLISGLDKVNAALSTMAKASQGASAANDNLSKSFGNADSHVVAYREHLQRLVVTQQAAAAAASRAATAEAAARAITAESTAATVAATAATTGLAAASTTSTAAVAGSAAAAGAAATATTGLAVASTEGAAAAAGGAVAAEAAGVGFLGLAGGAVAATVAVVAAVAAIVVVGTVIATAVFAAITFAGAFLSLRESVGKSTDALGLNEKQLDRLKKKGIDTGVTLQDAFTGLGYAIGQAFKDLAEQFKPLVDAAKMVWDDVVAFSSAALDTILKATIGSVAAIIAVWSDIPAVITDLFYQGVNSVIDGYNAIVQAGWDWLAAIISTVASIPGAIGDAFSGGVSLAGSAFNTLLDWSKSAFTSLVYLWQNWPQILGDLFLAAVKAAYQSVVWLYEKSRDTIKALVTGGAALMTGNVGHVQNSAAGAAAAAADKATAAYTKAGTAYDKFKVKFSADFKKGTLDARTSRLTDAAGAAGKDPKERQGPKVYTYDDLLKDAAKTRDGLLKTQAGIGLYGEALARATYEQDLLNKASEHGLKLSPQQRTAIAGIASEMAKLSESNRTSKFMEDFNQATIQQIASLEQQRGAIGLTGAALAAYTYEQTELNKALAAHITLTDADKHRIHADATTVGAKTYGNTVANSAAANDKSNTETMRQLGVERDALNLTGQALISYNYQQGLINQALNAGVALKDIDIEKTRQQADAYAAQRDAIDKQRQALADAREVTKGFFSDFINGARDGANIFAAFGNAAVNALNKIIDKLLDKGLNSMLDKLFSGGSGGGLLGSILGGSGTSRAAAFQATYKPDYGIGVSPGAFAKGGAFDQAQRFANGGAFTNSVVTSPTLFRFANGAQLGEMGEAGPEAIMPLKRGPNGSLGVQVHGGGKSSVRMGDIHNTYQVSGAIDQSAIVSMVRQGGEATYNQVKRDLQSLLQQLSTDGAVAS